MAKHFPATPQSGFKPIMLTPEQQKRILARRVEADRADPFATDANDEVRTLGRLALRRAEFDTADYMALGDMCARLSLHDDQLLVFYVGKTLMAYRRVRQQAHNAPERKTAGELIEVYVRWLVSVAREAPTIRNMAVALWAASEISPDDQADDLRDTVMDLAGQYLVAASGTASTTNTDDARRLIEGPAQPVALLTTTSHEQVFNVLDTQPDVFDTQGDDVGSHEPSRPTGHGTSRDTDADSSDWSPVSASFHALPTIPPTLPPDSVPGSGSPLSSPIILPAPESEPRDSGNFRVGDLIGGRYEVRQILRGGMGVIYLCWDRDDHQTVAIKTFQGRFLDNQRAVARFVHEAHTWIRLEKHNHIVQARLVKDFGSDRFKERPHIILEHIAGPEGLGPDLKSWIDHRRLDLPTTLEIGLHICLGMQHAVQKVPGLVHRDLKPANILVRHDGVAKVTDFGLVHSLENVPEGDPLDAGGAESAVNRLTRAGAIVGTAPYMSPEQCTGAEVDLRSDIYAFGAILYEMLTGQTMFAASTFDEWLAAHINEMPNFPTAAAVPGSLKYLTLRCLSKDPDKRPADWGVLVDELAGLYEEVTGKPAVFDVTGPAMEARELMDQAYSLTELGLAEEALTAHERSLELAPDSAWAWTSKGRTLRLMNRYEEALACYEKALELDPRFAWAWTSKAIILERLGQLDDALEAYQRSAGLRPDDLWPLYHQAGLLRDLDRHDEALEKLDKALTMDPRHALSHARRGQVLRALQYYPEALAAYDEAIQLDPRDGNFWDGKGLVLKIMGRAADAIPAFMQATRLMPDRPWPWEHLADTLIDEDRYSEALPVIQQALRLSTQDKSAQSTLWARQGQVLRQLRRYGEALDAYDHALQLKPDASRALMGKGIVLDRLGRLEDATALFGEATRCDPADPWTWYHYGGMLTTLGKFREAIPPLRCVIKLDTRHAGGWAKLGSTLRRNGKPRRALYYLDRALAIDGAYSWAWNEKGIALEALRRSEEALIAYQTAADCAPTETMYRYNEADMLMALGRFEEALPVLERLLMLDPDQQRGWAKLGQTYRRLGRLAEALTAYERSIAVDPHSAWALNGKGLTLSALNRHEEALACFAQASRENPHDVWHWYNQADELLALDHFQEAVDLLDRALAADEMHMESWAKRGQALRRLGRYKEALASYDSALAIDAHYAWAWNGRGLALEQMNRREEAILSYERAAKEDPLSVWYWLNQVDPLLTLGRREEALDVCKKAIDALPDEPIPWARKGQILRRLDRHEEALDAYEMAVQINPKYAWAWNGKGLAYKALGRWEEALGCFERAVREDSTDAWFWHNQGEALMELGRYGEAVRIFDATLALDPKNNSARTKRVEARKKRHDSSDE